MPFRAWRCAGAMALARRDLALPWRHGASMALWDNSGKNDERATNALRTRRGAPQRYLGAMALAWCRGVQTVTLRAPR